MGRIRITRYLTIGKMRLQTYPPQKKNRKKRIQQKDTMQYSQKKIAKKQ